MNADTEGSEFVIKDKRHTQKSDEEIKKEAETPPSQETDNENLTDDKIPKDFQINFSTFLLSLASSAFYNLGDMADPQTGEKKVDLSAVKQTIDILNMIKEKTQGNLEDEEKKLLEQLMYELQMKFVAQQKK